MIVLLQVLGIPRMKDWYPGHGGEFVYAGSDDSCDFVRTFPVGSEFTCVLLRCVLEHFT